MSFDYKKAKSKSEDSHGNSWTAYSDLFMMLSTVFLLLYVSVNLRTQAGGVQAFQQVKQLQAQNADLQQQIQVYNTLRDNHLKTEGTQQENEVYQKLMSKLDLLSDEAKDEKNKLRAQAKENENKEYALNEYQRMIRNIINTNVLSKTQIKRSDVIIEKKDTINAVQKETIAGQETEITNLNQTVEQKQAEIERTQQKIKLYNAELQRKIAVIRHKEEESEISKAQMNKKIAELKAQSAKQLKGLETQHQAALTALNQVQNSLAKAEKEAQEKGTELEETKAENAQMQAMHDIEAQALRNQAATKEAQLKDQFNKDLANERMTGEEKAKRLAKFAADAKARENALGKQLGALGEQIKATEGKLSAAEGKANEASARASEAADKASKAEADKGRALAAVQGLQKDKAQLSGELAHAQAMANARKELAGKIRGELAKAGLKGDVDGKTGDVTLSFGEEYFDTGSAELKPAMRETLKKFMPGYSKSLFSDQNIAKNIDNVEIVGFASSTFQGRYVPPDSLKPEDREAINYNLKLSFNRADSIFRHIFDTHKMSFEHQRDLLPKIKVVGRGYLPDGKSSADIPEGISERQFCAQYNCKQAQKVIIKFKLKD